MKTLFFAMLVSFSVLLSGCAVYVTPPGVYPVNTGTVYVQPQPMVYTNYYTPPIDYRRPQGVWYPWGNMNGRHDDRRNHKGR
jgi:hypothetical protein